MGFFHMKCTRRLYFTLLMILILEWFNHQKAFDAIGHEILLRKLKVIRFLKATIQWLRTYLAEWIFLVNIESKLSDLGKISCGIWPGSILGPLLSLICVNDMAKAVKLTLHLYADDSCNMYQHKEVNEIKKQLNKDFENIFEWFVDNKLSIHFGKEKTKLIIFARKRRSKNFCQLNIGYKHTHIKQHLQVIYKL